MQVVATSPVVTGTAGSLSYRAGSYHSATTAAATGRLAVSSSIRVRGEGRGNGLRTILR